MRQIKYNNDDPRWANMGPEHRGFKAPNVFLHVLLDNLPFEKLENIDTFIETGTHEGETSKIFSEVFDSVHTVEKYVVNNPYGNRDFTELYKKIRETHPNISFYEGDSIKFLQEILSTINKQCVLLLDAHAHSKSPLAGELSAIKDSSVKNNIIIIDDCVQLGSGNWPTQEQFESLIRDINSNYKIVNTGIGNDIILVYV